MSLWHYWFLIHIFHIKTFLYENMQEDSATERDSKWLCIFIWKHEESRRGKYHHQKWQFYPYRHLKMTVEPMPRTSFCWILLCKVLTSSSQLVNICLFCIINYCMITIISWHISLINAWSKLEQSQAYPLMLICCQKMH